jgi:hypothetical protein
MLSLQIKINLQPENKDKKFITLKQTKKKKKNSSYLGSMNFYDTMWSSFKRFAH